jgi:hypothetical protein
VCKKNKGFLKDKIMDDKMMKNYFVVNPWPAAGQAFCLFGLRLVRVGYARKD